MVWWVWLPLAVPAVLIVLSAVVCWFERRHAWPFEAVASLDTVSPHGGAALPPAGSITDVSPSPYRPPPVAADPGLPLTTTARTAGEALAAVGYEYLGQFRDRRGGIYQIRTDMMWSDDQAVTALIAGGSLLSVPIEAVQLLSLIRFTNREGAEDWRLIDSTNNEKSYEVDFLGHVETMIFQGASLEKLHHYHHQRLSLGEALPMDASVGRREEMGAGGDPVQNLRAIFEGCLQAGVRRGFYTEVEPGVGKATWTGGLAIALANQRIMWGRRLYPHARRLKRRMAKVRK